MNDPVLLHCPKCKNRQDNVSLGSVTTDGYLIFKRKYGRYTMVMASEYSVICDCGFAIRIHEGKVSSGALTGLPVNG